jgi:hypothetical protein
MLQQGSTSRARRRYCRGEERLTHVFLARHEGPSALGQTRGMNGACDRSCPAARELHCESQGAGSRSDPRPVRPHDLSL